MIELRGVRKRFGEAVALDGVTLSIGQGEIFGYIGPNGAGKTTTLRILATVEEADEGEIRIGGTNAVRDAEAVRRWIGYMPETYGMYEDLLVWEYLDTFARVYDLPAGTRDRAIADVLELTDLVDRRESGIETLSRGMRQRLFLAKTLLHEPRVLLLDEPTSALDPRARVEFQEILRELSRRGKTILWSSHILGELAEVCHRVAILEKGQVRAIGTIDSIRAALAPRPEVRIRLLGDAAPARAALEGCPGVVEPVVEGNLLRFQFAGPREAIPELHRRVVSSWTPTGELLESVSRFAGDETTKTRSH
ncbi:MAG: ABC transporter ATP-binding protein [Planctomycetes bacterium]|nr:ABC transporter ATP-binding protein [Planctomycetota bacterium]